MSAELLDRRSLNRAVLHRQLLVRRSLVGVVDAIEQLVGLNAQHPNDPYLALAARLSEFELADLTAVIEDRRVVRSTMMRATQHLVAATDFRGCARYYNLCLSARSGMRSVGARKVWTWPRWSPTLGGS